MNALNIRISITATVKHSQLTHSKPILYPSPTRLSIFRRQRRICERLPQFLYRGLTPHIHDSFYVPAFMHRLDEIEHVLVFPLFVPLTVERICSRDVCVSVNDALRGWRRRQEMFFPRCVRHFLSHFRLTVRGVFVRRVFRGFGWQWCLDAVLGC